MKVKCEACKGTGTKHGRVDDVCPVCHGWGVVNAPQLKGAPHKAFLAAEVPTEPQPPICPKPEDEFSAEEIEKRFISER